MSYADLRTHEAIARRLCGDLRELAPGRARVVLETVPEMAADQFGLVHGGFIFGLADYAAMLAVNHPNVVLGAAEVRFVAPVVVGARVEAIARLEITAGRKREVVAEVTHDGSVVFTGRFTCFVPERHVLGASEVGR